MRLFRQKLRVKMETTMNPIDILKLEPDEQAAEVRKRLGKQCTFYSGLDWNLAKQMQAEAIEKWGERTWLMAAHKVIDIVLPEHSKRYNIRKRCWEYKPSSSGLVYSIWEVTAEPIHYIVAALETMRIAKESGDGSQQKGG